MQKKVFSLVIALFVSTGLSYADVYVVHKNGEIYSVSDRNDAVVPVGHEVKVLSGTIADLSLSRPIDEYEFKGGKFKANAKKIKDKEDAVLAAETKQMERKAKKKQAVDKLLALGLTSDEIEALTGGQQ